MSDQLLRTLQNGVYVHAIIAEVNIDIDLSICVGFFIDQSFDQSGLGQFRLFTLDLGRYLICRTLIMTGRQYTI